MKNSIIRKLKNKKGESLTETLVALLISVLSLTLLASMIVSGNKITAQSREKMTQYYAQNSIIAQGSSGGVSGSISIKKGSQPFILTEAGSSSIPVKYFVNDEFSSTPVVSYR